MTYHKCRHRGLALLLVLTVVGLASVVGLSILSSASLYAQMGGNSAKAASAEYLSESAIQTAVFYLQNPSLMPAAWSSHAGYTIYADNLTLSGLDGSFDIRVRPGAGTDVYDIETSGRSPGGSAVARAATAQIRAVRATPQSAAAFGGGITIGGRHTFNGPLVAGGTVVLSGGVVNGTVRESFNGTDFAVPSAATVNYYGAGAVPGSYTMPNGTTGTPQSVSGTITGFPAADGTNPGNVFYSNGDLTVNAASTINFNGTLVVLGNLTVQGTNFTITPVSQMPALVNTGQLKMFFKNITLRVNGVAWLGGGTAWTGGLNHGSNIIIDGALMMPSGVNLGTTATGSMTVNYSSSNASVASLTTSSQMQPITGVRLLDWQQ
jgi:hypothetical protein